MEIENDNKEYRAGAFFGVLACVLVLALTAMAMNAFGPPRPEIHASWDVAVPEPNTTVVPSFGS